MPADERSPAPGDLTGWSPERGPSWDRVLELLAGRDIEVVGRMPWSSNMTFLVTLVGDDDEPVSAVYKPLRGERSLWDFPDGLYRREVAAFALSEFLGWGIVPPTVAREDGPLGEGSLQLFVEADFSQHYFTLFDEGGHEDVLRTICAFDVVANNADRKSGHVLRGDGGRLWAIDNGLSFHPEPKLRTVIWDFAEEDVDRRLLADLERLTGVPEEIAGLLSVPERRALEQRACRLIESGTFPEPIGDRPPYPWPLV
jgi:uncharacterized repeat protein (TIGR03843 family)